MRIVAEIPFVFFTQRASGIFVRLLGHFGKFHYVFVIFFGLTQIYSYFENVIPVFISPAEISRNCGFLNVIVHNAYFIEIITGFLSAEFFAHVIKRLIYRRRTRSYKTEYICGEKSCLRIVGR